MGCLVKLPLDALSDLCSVCSLGVRRETVSSMHPAKARESWLRRPTTSARSALANLEMARAAFSWVSLDGLESRRSWTRSCEIFVWFCS